MPLWLCRDPKMTDDQNRVATLREGSAGGWQRQPLGCFYGITSKSGGTALYSIAVKCSSLREREKPAHFQKKGYGIYICKVVLLLLPRLVSWKVGLVLLNMHFTLEVINPQPSSFHSSSFSSASLPFAIMWEVFLGSPLPPWRSNTGSAAEFLNLWGRPASSSLSFH